MLKYGMVALQSHILIATCEVEIYNVQFYNYKHHVKAIA
jgi:hypothetical protein